MCIIKSVCVAAAVGPQAAFTPPGNSDTFYIVDWILLWTYQEEEARGTGSDLFHTFSNDV